MPVFKTSEQTALLIQLENITSIYDDDDSVIQSVLYKFL